MFCSTPAPVNRRPRSATDLTGQRKQAITFRWREGHQDSASKPKPAAAGPVLPQPDLAGIIISSAKFADRVDHAAYRPGAPRLVSAPRPAAPLTKIERSATIGRLAVTIVVTTGCSGTSPFT